MLWPVADLEAIARLLARGGSSLADSAGAEARRVLDELVARGDLGRDEADRIEAAVREAAEQHRRWVDERVIGPLRRALRGVVTTAGQAVASASGARGAPAGDDVAARLAAIEERLARIEGALAGRGRE
jgi:polyhydroxyalkanoate synthesis regulator phasin